MFFDNYKDFPEATINPSLLWEYDITRIDYKNMQDIIVQRVIERGWPNDWYAMLNIYGVDEVKKAIKNISYLKDKDMNFVSHQFNIPLSAMKCSGKKQLALAHWNS